MELIQVRWRTEGAVLKGTVTFDAKERSKIAFLSGYRPEASSSFRGLLPRNGEEWVCDVHKDTQPQDARRGALIVALRQKAETRWELMPGENGMELFGVRRVHSTKFVGLRPATKDWGEATPAALEEERSRVEVAFRAAETRVRDLLTPIAQAQPVSIESVLTVSVNQDGLRGSLVGTRSVTNERMSRSWSFTQNAEHFGVPICVTTVTTAIRDTSGWPGGGFQITDWQQAVHDLGAPATVMPSQYGGKFVANWDTGGAAGFTAALSHSVALAGIPHQIEAVVSKNDAVYITVTFERIGSIDILAGSPESGYGDIIPARFEIDAALLPEETRKSVADMLRESVRPHAEWNGEKIRGMFCPDEYSRNDMRELAVLGSQLLLAATATNVVVRSRIWSEGRTEPESPDGYRAESHYTVRVTGYWIVCDGQEISLGQYPEGWSRGYSDSSGRERRRFLIEKLRQYEGDIKDIARAVNAGASYLSTPDPVIYAGSRADEWSEAANILHTENLAVCERIEEVVAGVRAIVRACLDATDPEVLRPHAEAKLGKLEAEATALETADTRSRWSRRDARFSLNKAHQALKQEDDPAQALEFLCGAQAELVQYAVEIETVKSEQTERETRWAEEKAQQERAHVESERHEVATRLEFGANGNNLLLGRALADYAAKVCGASEAITLIEGELNASYGRGVRQSALRARIGESDETEAVYRLSRARDLDEVLKAALVSLRCTPVVSKPAVIAKPMDAKPASIEQVATSLDALKGKFGKKR